MASIQSVLESLTSDPAVWAHVQKELQGASDPPARLRELASERGLTVDSDELDQMLQRARRELDEGELDQVSGGAASLQQLGFNPQPDPPVNYSPNQELIGLLLPAVQKKR
jgi:hypothetical protein